MQDEIIELMAVRTIQDYHQYIRNISKKILAKFPEAVESFIDGQVTIKKLEQMSHFQGGKETSSQNSLKGRGGNNVAENMKKSFISVLRKVYTQSIYKYFLQNYVNKYELKSQKENFVLYLLFLEEMRQQGRITANSIERVIALIRQRINKYILGSEQRMEAEPERREFHEKNMVQFKKFADLDMDFTRPRNYSEIKDWIRSLYLKKKAVFYDAEKKVRTILKNHESLAKLFGDLLYPSPSPQRFQQNSSNNDEEYQKDSCISTST